MEKRLKMTVMEIDAGKTIQEYLKDPAGFSKAQIKSMKFRENGICLNGEQSRVTARLRKGDVLELLVDDERKNSEHLVSDVGLPVVLYEDEDVIVVNKPSGTAVHPSHGHYSDTLANQMAAYFRQKQEIVQVHSIGRLDKETSGVVLFAKNRIAAARLSKQREQGKLRKQYLAVCAWEGGELPENRISKGEYQVISEPIAPLEGSLMKMSVHKEGKPAVTHYCVEEYFADAALLRLWLETGRTHQIRVHMASLGHPLLGDLLYGGNDMRLKRAALHAEILEFYQPFTGEKIWVRAELPKDMADLIKTQK